MGELLYPRQVEVEELARCTGHCCRSFFIPYSPAELMDRASQPGAGPEDMQIAQMVVPLPQPVQLGVGSYYTCKHFDGTGCKIYETRPKMCSDYPYQSDCAFKDCTRKVRKITLYPLRINNLRRRLLKLLEDNE